VQETTALGAAYLAGLAEGVWSTPAEVSANWQLDRTFTPGVDATATEARHTAWRRAVERSRGWADGD
jgi:glycerol kinase